MFIYNTYDNQQGYYHVDEVLTCRARVRLCVCVCVAIDDRRLLHAWLLTLTFAHIRQAGVHEPPSWTLRIEGYLFDQVRVVCVCAVCVLRHVCRVCVVSLFTHVCVVCVCGVR
jgi:hypothetical protein